MAPKSLLNDEFAYGRLGILGLSTLLVFVFIGGTSTATSLQSISIPSFWWLIGVYAG